MRISKASASCVLFFCIIPPVCPIMNEPARRMTESLSVFLFLLLLFLYFCTVTFSCCLHHAACLSESNLYWLSHQGYENAVNKTLFITHTLVFLKTNFVPFVKFSGNSVELLKTFGFSLALTSETAVALLLNGTLTCSSTIKGCSIDILQNSVVLSPTCSKASLI